MNPIQAFYQAELRPAESNTVAISGPEANVSASGGDTVINKLNCVTLIALIVGLNSISDARAETDGGTKLNETAVVFATERIKQGDVVADGKGAWIKDRPSVSQENEFIRLHGFAEYAKWHLGIDDRFPETSKRRYKFPYGDFKTVHRCGLLAAKARARQYGYTGIRDAAAELLRPMKTKRKD